MRILSFAVIAFLLFACPPAYSQVCDGVTDDTAAFVTAIAAANRKVLALPAGATCVTRRFEICSNPICLTGNAGGNVPLIIEGNGARLLAPAAASGATNFVYVEMQTATAVHGFAIRNLTIDAGNHANRGITVVGCVYCTFENINEKNAQFIGCDLTAMVGYVFANNLISRVQCNNNNTNSGSTGYGVREITTGTWLGAADCSAFPQNAGNTFISTHAMFNGAIGWIVDCANNSHINPDMEMNLSWGLSITQVVASEWIGAQFSSNKNARGPAGTGGDSSVLNNDASPGLQFFGGASDGIFSNVSAANNDTLAMRGVTGFAYTANCNGSGHYCMTLP